jgi:hypothetical protein
LLSSVHPDAHDATYRSPPLEETAKQPVKEKEKAAVPQNVPQGPRLIPPWQIVSNARGPYPQLEIFGVSGPRKDLGKASAGPSRRHVSDPAGPSDAASTKSARRISRKLADVSYPGLSVFDKLNNSRMFRWGSRMKSTHESSP